MKNPLFLLVAFFAIQITAAQEKNLPQEKSIDDNLIYNSSGIEVKPEYPGGMEAFYKLISNNYITPSDKAFKGGKVFVTFIIEKDGSMTEMKAIRDRGFGTGEEAIRVLKLCEKWQPAEQNGKKVRVLYSLPISLTSN